MVHRYFYEICDICLSFIYFVCHSVNSSAMHKQKLTKNMVVMGKEWPVQVLKFWCRSESRCGSKITFLNITTYGMMLTRKKAPLNFSAALQRPWWRFALSDHILFTILCAALVPKLFPRKSHQSALVHILPVVWSLISTVPSAAGGVANSAANLRSATARLVGALYLEIGEALLDAANNSSNVSLCARQNLKQIVDVNDFVSRG